MLGALPGTAQGMEIHMSKLRQSESSVLLRIPI